MGMPSMIWLRIRLRTFDVGLWTGPLPFEASPLLDSFLNLLLDALLGRLVIAFVGAQIILHYEMFRMIMGIFIADAVSQPFRALVMRIPQMLGHGQCPA